MSLPYTLVAPTHKQIGLVALQSDETIEMDLHRMRPDDAELLVTRVPSATTVTSDTLAQMANSLTAATKLFPQSASFSAVGYGCTSGTAQIGIARIANLVKAGTTTQNVSEPVSGLIAACRALGVTRLGIISPYIASVSSRLRDVLDNNGITTAGFDSFDEPEERKVVRIAPASIYDAAVSLAKNTQCDALFLSCTNLRTLDVIDPIEAETGLPVLSSNQVLAWHLGQLAQTNPPGFAPGRLWKA